MPLDSKERLVRELKIIAADDRRARLMVKAAERGEYDDALSPHATPKMLLVTDLHELGALGEALARRVMAGEFDTTREEWKL